MTTKPYTVVLHKNSNQKNFGIYIGEDIPNGIYIVTLEPNSPAAHSNIQPGDRVLAVNGQLLSQISINPREFISNIANTTESLTLSIEPSDLLKFVDYPSINNNNNISSNKPYRYVSKQSNGIDHNLENYIKSLFGDENLHLLPSGSSNRNEYVLTSDSHSSRPHHRHHRKRQSRKGLDTQLQPHQPIIDEQKDNISSLPRQRSIPNMGTSQVLLRNSQQNPKDNEMHEFPEIKTLPNITAGLTNTDFSKNDSVLPNSTFGPVLSPQESYDYSRQPSSPSNITPHQSFKNPPSPPAKTTNPSFSAIQNLQTPLAGPRPPPPPPSSSNNNNSGFRELRLHRIPEFNGFGFHLQYNKLYYTVQQIEPKSPSELGGLHSHDVIVRVNDQPTTNMSHQTFVQIVNASTDLILLVQSYEDYARDNPEALRAPPTQQSIIANTNNNNNNNNNIRKVDDKSQNVFSKALTKLKSR